MRKKPRHHVKPSQIGGRPEVCGKGAGQCRSGRPIPWPVLSAHCPASPPPPPPPRAASPREQLGLPLGKRKHGDHRVSAGLGGFPPVPASTPLHSPTPRRLLQELATTETPSYTTSPWGLCDFQSSDSSLCFLLRLRASRARSLGFFLL